MKTNKDDFIFFKNKNSRYDCTINIFNLSHYFHRISIISLNKLVNLLLCILLIKIKDDIETIQSFQYNFVIQSFFLTDLMDDQKIVQYFNITNELITANNTFHISPCFDYNLPINNTLIGSVSHDRICPVHFTSQNVVTLFTRNDA